MYTIFYYIIYFIFISARILQNPVSLGLLKDDVTAQNYFADFLRVLYAPQSMKDDLSTSEMPNDIFPLVSSDAGDDHEEENYDQIRRKEFPAVNGVLLPALQKRNARYCGSYLVIIIINNSFRDTTIII